MTHMKLTKTSEGKIKLEGISAFIGGGDDVGTAMAESRPIPHSAKSLN